MKNNYLEFTQNTTLWLIVFASFSIALPTTFMSIATVLFMIFWAISGDYKIKFERISSNPAALASIALFGLYAVATLYSSAPWDHRLSFLGKYQKLLFIPLIVSVMYSEKFRQYAMNAFLLSMIMVLIISYLKWLGLVPHHDINQGYMVFKGRIAHNIFMSFAMFLMMHRALKSAGSIRLTWIILSILAGLNILFLVNGRTGQITMMVLIVWFTIEVWGKKSLKYWFGLVLIGMVLHQMMPGFPHSRLMDTKQELADHQPNGNQTSAGLRMEMYKNTITLIKDHPFFGGGTASLESEYEILAKNKNFTLTRVANPHNQFLLTTQELGILGLAMLILMWLSHWKASYQIGPAQDSSALRGLVLT
ncbi:MAG: O-antigen ligase family protein, partial [Methylococcaceae bacterium]|nr:O-antigen ligase family protein [Methylococcaceae bacterium]